MIACLFLGALNLNERQFGEVYNLAQKYSQQAGQFQEVGENAGRGMPGFKQLMEAGKAEILGILTPEQAKIFGKMAPQLQAEPGRFNFNFNFQK